MIKLLLRILLVSPIFVETQGIPITVASSTTFGNPSPQEEVDIKISIFLKNLFIFFFSSSRKIFFFKKFLFILSFK